MYIICPHHVYVTIVYFNSMQSCVTMQKKNNFKCYFSELFPETNDNLWVFLFLLVQFLFCFYFVELKQDISNDGVKLF